MRYLLLIGLLFGAGSVEASAGQKYRNTDTKLNDEISNIYHEINSVFKGDVRITSATITNLTATTITTSASLGKLLNVYISSSVTSTTTTSSTAQATTLTRTITPVSASSRFIVIAQGHLRTAGEAKQVKATVFRDASDIGGLNGFHYIDTSGTLVESIVPCTLVTYDAPASATAIVYNVRVLSVDNATSVSWGDTTSGVMTMVILEYTL